jgi:hypothetical protein
MTDFETVFEAHINAISCSDTLKKDVRWFARGSAQKCWDVQQSKIENLKQELSNLRGDK